MCSPHRGFVISRVFSICLDYGWSQENRSPRTSSYLYYSNKFMHGFVKFLIVLLRSLLLCFCTVFNVKTIQYNAIHKFVGVLDNPPRLMLSEGWKCYCRDPIENRGACPRTPLATRAFRARHCPPPINLTLLRHCILPVPWPFVKSRLHCTLIGSVTFQFYEPSVAQ